MAMQGAKSGLDVSKGQQSKSDEECGACSPFSLAVEFVNHGTPALKHFRNCLDSLKRRATRLENTKALTRYIE